MNDTKDHNESSVSQSRAHATAADVGAEDCKPKQHPSGDDVGHTIRLQDSSTREQRDAHLEEVKRRNHPYAENFKGIRGRFELGLKGYHGIFHPNVIEWIKRQTVVVRVEEDACVTYIKSVCRENKFNR